MLSFESIHYAYHKRPVLQDVSFNAVPGEITCVVGPSGCGKTTLLALAAGLLEMQQGTVSLDGDVLARPGFSLPPEQRPVGLVFQEGALFPHLTVAENVGFGVSGAQRNARVDELLALVGLSEEARRHPHTLSGGQRQRVALARALAPRPRALLFDEPYANLDQALRQALRVEARDMVRESGTIGVFVTHDPEDVMTLADQVVVLDEGLLLQKGSPRELFDAPACEVVAQLFGRTQKLDAVLQADGLVTSFGTWPLKALAAQPGLSRFQTGERLRLIIRPDTLYLQADSSDPGSDGPFIREIRLAGADDLAEIQDAQGQFLNVGIERPHSLKAGSRVKVQARSQRIFAFPLS